MNTVIPLLAAVIISAFSPAPNQEKITQSEQASIPVVHFRPPPKVCVYSEVDQNVVDALAHRQDPALRSIKDRNLNSQVLDQISGSVAAGGVPLHDPRGAPIVFDYRTKAEAIRSCRGMPGSALASISVSLAENGKPYKLTASISQGEQARSLTFSRDVLAELEAYDRKVGNPLPFSDKAPPVLRTGPSISVNGDVAQLFADLLQRVFWNIND